MVSVAIVSIAIVSVAMVSICIGLLLAPSPAILGRSTDLLPHRHARCRRLGLLSRLGLPGVPGALSVPGVPGALGRCPGGGGTGYGDVAAGLWLYLVWQVW